MRTIYKYPIKVGTVTTFKIPKGAKFLHFGPDPSYIKLLGYEFGRVAFWFEVETEMPVENRNFVIAGTGHELHQNSVCIASTVVDSYAWHAQELIIS